MEYHSYEGGVFAHLLGQSCLGKCMFWVGAILHYSPWLPHSVLSLIHPSWALSTVSSSLPFQIPSQTPTEITELLLRTTFTSSY